eukprot:scaffold120874_cov39-Tisochrysis_lutea.AAC.1
MGAHDVLWSRKLLFNFQKPAASFNGIGRAGCAVLSAQEPTQGDKDAQEENARIHLEPPVVAVPDEWDSAKSVSEANRQHEAQRGEARHSADVDGKCELPQVEGLGLIPCRHGPVHQFVHTPAPH